MTATLSVILFPVWYRAVVVWRKLAGGLCKAGARKKGPKSNSHQHCEWTSGKRAPLGCPRQFGFGAHRRLEVVVSRRNEEREKRGSHRHFSGDISQTLDSVLYSM